MIQYLGAAGMVGEVTWGRGAGGLCLCACI